MVLCRRINCKELKAYNVVFISSADNAAEIIRDSHGLSIVSVSDKPNFANQEGIIGLVLAPDNYRFSFEIYFDTAQAAYVHTSTRILQLAERVYTAK